MKWRQSKKILAGPRGQSIEWNGDPWDFAYGSPWRVPTIIRAARRWEKKTCLMYRLAYKQREARP